LGEIKSTLDLVLEKTKNLTLSKDEKLSLAREELDKKVQGFVNRYVNNFLPLNRLKEEIEKIDTKVHGLTYTLLKKHLLTHLDLDSDNSSILSALSEIAGFDIAPLNALQKEHNSVKEEKKRSFITRGLEALEERGVSGSAVEPNLNHIPEWDQFLTRLHKKYRERIRTIENG
jgi:hypothetical protein